MGDLIIKKNKEKIIQRGHPWVFSGALQTEQDFPPNGSIVRLLTREGEFLAKGHYQDSSIAVRILSYKDEEVNTDFYTSKMKSALQLRDQLMIKDETNAFRWVHGEGDRLPGLVVDYYNDHVVMECHTDGMFLQREAIAQAIEKIFPTVQTIFCKPPSISRKDHIQKENDYLLGSKTQTTILENGHQFLVNWEDGQKTGFFLDQRENRHLLDQIAIEKDVLNLFSYSGGFSIYAAANKARKVTSVDVSEQAIHWLKQNIELNEQDESMHEYQVSDVMDYLKSAKDHDIIVVDPPAFAKSKKKRHNAVQAYKRLNANAVKRVNSGGYLMTFSCSQVVSPRLFYDTIKASFIQTGRSGQIIRKLSQGPDHPVLMKHEEGSYLKGLLIRVE